MIFQIFIGQLLFSILLAMEGTMYCPICHCNQGLSLKTSCNHEFCPSCLKSHLVQNPKKCPLCRTNLPNTVSIQGYPVQVYSSLTDVGLEEIKKSFTILCKTNNLRLVKNWFEYGADVNSKEWKRTPLYIASEHGRLNIVRFLITHGAEVNEPAWQFASTPPLCITILNGHLPEL